MNIHITKEQSNYLSQFAEYEVIFGSHMYGCNNENSDTDIMIIIDEKAFICNLFDNHHQFQYKDSINKEDLVYTTNKQFINNLVNGDSTINFEIIASKNNDYFNDVDLNIFITKKIMSLYLGLAKRDAKANKKFHALRGYRMGKLLKECFDNNYSDKVVRSKINTEFENYVKLKQEANKFSNDILFTQAMRLQKEIKNNPRIYDVDKIKSKEQMLIWKSLVNPPEELESLIKLRFKYNFEHINYKK